MTHLTDVIEEEIFRIIGTNDSPIYKVKRADLTQAMTKAALAVIEEIEKLPRRSTVTVEEKSDGTIIKSYTVALSDIETIKNTLTK